MFRVKKERQLVQSGKKDSMLRVEKPKKKDNISKVEKERHDQNGKENMLRVEKGKTTCLELKERQHAEA